MLAAVILSFEGVPNPINGKTMNKVKTSKLSQLKFIESTSLFRVKLSFILSRKTIH
jgi:hypothetical protein